jgi:large subunit ribosomal protein L1
MAEAKKQSKKEDLLAEAKKLNLSVTTKNTIAQIEEMIAESKAAQQSTNKIEELVETEAIAEEIIKVEAELNAEEAEAEVNVAKAGKRSTKAIKEAEEKAEKEARKASDETEVAKPKPPVKVRSRLERQGKKFQQASKLVEKGKEYSIGQAMEIATQTSTTKFDSSVELHVRLGVDPRQADQNIRTTLILPAGTGKNVKVAVFAEDEDVVKAKKAGADIAGNEEFLLQLDKGVIDFDVLVATPAVMPKLGKYARTLGPKGLMPSPKSGTVSADVAKAVQEAKAGKVEYRVDSTGIVHLSIGKVSFGPDKLKDNAKAVFASIKSVKPASLKGSYVLSIYASTTMGPSIKITTTEI